MADLTIKGIDTKQGVLPIDYTALANKPTVSNPNLIINGSFDIWQRGERFNNHPDAYCADRWNVRHSNVSTFLIEKSVDVPSNVCVKNSMHVINENNTNTYLQYHFENSLKGLYTLSFWYKSTVAFRTFIIDGDQWNGLGDNGVSSVWTKASYTFTAESLNRINLIHEMNAGECYITGVKLEAGATSTEFSPRPYAEELALCRRYYQTIDLARLDVLCYLHHRNTDEYGGFIRIQPMRTTPTVTRTGYFFVEKYNSSGVHSVNENELQHLQFVPQFSGLKIGVGLSTQDTVNYLAVGSDSATIGFDAEIY